MMLRRILLWLVLFLGPAAAQAEPVRVALQTERGAILIEVDQDRAPLTSANFLRYVDRRLFDGSAFYRAMRLAPDSGLVQGGVDYRRTLPPVAHEPTTRTGLSHVDGAVSMARAEAGSARSDFFIIVGDAMTGLDAGPNSGGDQLGYAVFGRVVEGMNLVRQILAAPTSATEGEGAMRGQMLEPRIRIVSARRAD
jgi:peptidyl-prolyl cis-trans isomerase A (cyclophilin A)